MGHIGRYEREKSKERFASLRGRKVIDASNDWYRAVDTIPQRHYTDALGEIANPLHHCEGGGRKRTAFGVRRYSYTVRLRVRNSCRRPKRPFSPR